MRRYRQTNEFLKALRDLNVCLCNDCLARCPERRVAAKEYAMRLTNKLKRVGLTRREREAG